MDSRFEMVVVFAMFGFCVGLAAAQLSSTYYDSSCPNLQSTVKAAVKSAVAKEKRMGASLLRLHFHDCFVNGCDASILLDDSSTVTGEKSAVPNANSVRGFDVIDDIKSQVESICSGVVSCSDILAIAARDSVVELGGPTWTVQLGRRDATSASLSGANTNIPGPTSNVSTLISKFSAQGLSTTDMVALSGSHTIGQARCKSFRSRIYDNTSTEAISSSYAKYLQKNCSSTSGGSDDDNLAPLDPGTATYFDGSYYTHVKSLMGLLHSDQDLYSGDSSETQSMIKNYASSSSKFFSDFTAAMLNMGNISPLTGSSGEIRTNCRQPNSS